MKFDLIMIDIQENLSDSEEIIKDSIFQWILFVMNKLMISLMIVFMFTSNYQYTMDALKQSILKIKQYLIL